MFVDVIHDSISQTLALLFHRREIFIALENFFAEHKKNSQRKISTGVVKIFLRVEHVINFRQQVRDEIFFAERQNRPLILRDHVTRRQIFQLHARKHKAISLYAVLLKRVFAVRHVRVADDKVPRRHRVLVIADNVSPARLGNVQKFQKIFVPMNHVRVLQAVLVVDKNHILQLNPINHEPPLPRAF